MRMKTRRKTHRTKRRRSGLVIAVALLASLTQSLAQNIVSRPVGFLRIEIPSQEQALLSTPFYAFNNSVNAMFKDQLAGSEQIEKADRIYKWDNRKSTYISAIKIDDAWYSDVDAKKLSGMDILPGEGFFIYNAQTVTQAIYLCGEIVLDENIAIDMELGLNLAAYPYPSPLNINESTLIELDVTSSGDQLVMADGVNYTLIQN